MKRWLILKELWIFISHYSLFNGNGGGFKIYILHARQFSIGYIQKWHFKSKYYALADYENK